MHHTHCKKKYTGLILNGAIKTESFFRITAVNVAQHSKCPLENHFSLTTIHLQKLQWKQLHFAYISLLVVTFKLIYTVHTSGLMSRQIPFHCILETPAHLFHPSFHRLRWFCWPFPLLACKCFGKFSICFNSRNLSYVKIKMTISVNVITDHQISCPNVHW